MFYSIIIIDLLTCNWTFKWFPKVHVNAQNNSNLLCLWLFVVCEDPQKSRDINLFPALYTHNLHTLQNVHPSVPSTSSYHHLDHQTPNNINGFFKQLIKLWRKQAGCCNYLTNQFAVLLNKSIFMPCI